MNPILPARLDWPSAIENFIRNYGALDWQVFVFLERRMPPKRSGMKTIPARAVSKESATLPSLAFYAGIMRLAPQVCDTSRNPCWFARQPAKHGAWFAIPPRK
jgi:hypothetical protein